MRTLFSDNIRSPLPSPVTIARPNPLELTFASSIHTSPSYTASTKSSPKEDEWLTKLRQTHDRPLANRRALTPDVGTDADADADANTDVDAVQSTPRHGQANQKGIPKVLIMGLSRSGKSSIQHVILKTKPAGETLYLEPTNQIVESATMESFIKLECVEVPSHLNVLGPGYNHEAVFGSAGSIVWVIDIQDENIHSINKLINTAVFLMENYPRIHFEVFIHKTDGLSDEYKNNTFRDVRQNIQDELNDRGHGDRGVAFHQTSIYDASIHEAMSKVVQRLLPQLPAVEALLTKLCSKCSMQKVYLFDTMSRIYLATDASPTFLRDFELCSEYVDMIVDAKNLYGWRPRFIPRPRSAYRSRQRKFQPNSTSASSDGDEDVASNDSLMQGSGEQRGQHQQSYGDRASDDEAYSHDDEADVAAGDGLESPVDSGHGDEEESDSLDASSAVGESSITLPGSQNLYMLGREINDYLSLICIMGQGSTPDRRVLIDYNISVAAEAIREIFRIE